MTARKAVLTLCLALLLASADAQAARSPHARPHKKAAIGQHAGKRPVHKAARPRLKKAQRAQSKSHAPQPGGLPKASVKNLGGA